jgi:hypothetical protein
MAVIAIFAWLVAIANAGCVVYGATYGGWSTKDCLQHFGAAVFLVIVGALAYGI